MPRASAYEHRSVLSPSGKRLGRVGAVLYDASKPRVVGLQIDRRAILGVFDRRPHFVLLADVEASGDELRYARKKLPGDAAGERSLGYSWEQTVIWRAMPVRSADGDKVGAVQDSAFDAASGVVTRLTISTGVFGDVALGRLEVPGDLVRGFDGEAVVVLPGYDEIRSAGGAAKVIASGTAAAKVRGGQVAEGALQVGVAASRALGRSLRSGAGRRAIDKLKSMMKDDG